MSTGTSEPTESFRVGAFAGGCARVVVVGGLAATVGGMMAGVNTGNLALGIGVGLIPGAVAIFLSRRARSNGFAQGLLVGACLILLLGGICGGMGAAQHGM